MKVINTGVDPIEEDLRCIRSSILTKAPTSTKRETYLCMDASLEIHPVYNTCVQEHRRIEFTRMRIGAHRLRIETGRWSRTPRENRVCRCNNQEVQDESHVLFTCPLTGHLREQYGFSTFEELFTCNDSEKICSFIYYVTRIFN